MVIAYHVIWSCRGFWLPNDPRGSWSTEVWAPHLRPFGPPTKTTARHSLANKSHDCSARRAAKAALKFPPVELTGLQARAVARGFASILPVLRLPVFACAIMPDHVHLVVGRHPEPAENL